MLCRLAVLAAATVAAPLPAFALESPARDSIDVLIEAQAKANHVPASFIHRVVKRESNYNPGAVGRGGALGLMQIKHATARGLGYKGPASGLLDARTNLTYAVAYLAGAYRTAKGNETQAYSYYAKGYYYAAKRQGITNAVAEADTAPTVLAASAAFATTSLGQFFARNFTGAVSQTAAPAPTAVASADPATAVPAPTPATNSVAAPATSPFAAAQGGSLGAQPAQAAPAVALAYAQPDAATAAVSTPEAGAEAAAAETTISVPLPPRRPHEFRLFAKKPVVAASKTAEVLGLRNSAEASAAQ